jgi:2-hydroxychromene-2-carboxylate isomerase
MKPPVEFYFDFSSPFGYLASQKIEALAAKHGRTVKWRPMLLGAAFKATGGVPLTQIPLKGEYAKRDFYRSARFHGLEYRHPEPFPVNTVAACRAFYSLAEEKDALRLAKALFKAYFADNVNIGEPDNVMKVAGTIGLAPNISDQAVKDKTKGEVDAALAKGVFGSPYVVVDGEPFWGLDRFPQLERWLATGGF